MLILFDKGTPWPLRHYLAWHTIHSAYWRGWGELPDGELLTIAESYGYELLITTDQRIKNQQNLTGRNIAILVLVDHNWPYSQAGINAITSAVEEMESGDYREVDLVYGAGH